MSICSELDCHWSFCSGAPHSRVMAGDCSEAPACEWWWFEDLVINPQHKHPIVNPFVSTTGTFYHHLKQIQDKNWGSFENNMPWNLLAMDYICHPTNTNLHNEIRLSTFKHLAKIKIMCGPKQGPQTSRKFFTWENLGECHGNLGPNLPVRNEYWAISRENLRDPQ